MPRVVCIDSMICVWGIKKKANAGQEHKIEAAEGLLETLSREGAILLLPAPVVTEILSPIAPKDRAGLLEKINKMFRIVPVDTLASVKAAELWHDAKNWREVYKKVGEDGMKNRFKYDIQVAAIAITRKVDFLYTEDDKLQKLCENFIQVGPIPIIGASSQLKMFGGEKKA